MPHSELHDVAPASVEMASPSTYALGDQAVGTGCLFRLGQWHQWLATRTTNEPMTAGEQYLAELRYGAADRRGGDEALKSGTPELSKLP